MEQAGCVHGARKMGGRWADAAAGRARATRRRGSGRESNPEGMAPATRTRSLGAQCTRTPMALIHAHARPAPLLCEHCPLAQRPSILNPPPPSLLSPPFPRLPTHRSPSTSIPPARSRSSLCPHSQRPLHLATLPSHTHSHAPPVTQHTPFTPSDPALCSCASFFALVPPRSSLFLDSFLLFLDSFLALS